MIKKIWAWLKGPAFREDLNPISAEPVEPVYDYNQQMQEWTADEHERDRKRSLETIPDPPDLTDDPDTDVPAPHLGQTQHIDFTKMVKAGEQQPAHLQDVGPSDWELLSDDEKQLFEQITPHDPSKVIAYPAPVEMTTADWVTEQLAKAGYSESYRLRFAGFRRVGVGMSMRHLGDLKRRAEARDTSLTPHDLIALRTRGIS